MKFFILSLSLCLSLLPLTSTANSVPTVEQLVGGIKEMQQEVKRLDDEKQAFRELINRFTLGGGDSEQIEELQAEYEKTVRKYDQANQIYQDALKALQQLDQKAWAEISRAAQVASKAAIDDTFKRKVAPAKVEALAKKFDIPLETIATPNTPPGLRGSSHEEIVDYLRFKVKTAQTWYDLENQKVKELSDLLRKVDAGTSAQEIAELQDKFSKAYGERYQAKSLLDHAKGVLESFDRAAFQQLEEETDAGLLLRSTVGKMVSDDATQNAWGRLFDEVDKKRAAKAHCADQVTVKHPKDPKKKTNNNK